MRIIRSIVKRIGGELPSRRGDRNRGAIYNVILMMAYEMGAAMGKVIVAAATPALVRHSPGRAPVSRESRAVLRTRNRAPFDPKRFFAKMGEGKAISEYRKDQIVFHTAPLQTRFFTS